MSVSTNYNDTSPSPVWQKKRSCDKDSRKFFQPQQKRRKRKEVHTCSPFLFFSSQFPPIPFLLCIPRIKRGKGKLRSCLCREVLFPNHFDPTPIVGFAAGSRIFTSKIGHCLALCLKYGTDRKLMHDDKLIH